MPDRACLGITAAALTVTLDGKPVLVIPRAGYADLIARLAVALRESG